MATGHGVEKSQTQLSDSHTHTHTHTHTIFTELSDALGNKDYNENVRALLLPFPNPASAEKWRPP